MRATLALTAALVPTLVVPGRPADPPPAIPVGAHNFVRAETDLYLSRKVGIYGLGKLNHGRELTPVEKQPVVRMNRDTLYTTGVFDLDAGPLTVALPDPGARFLSMQVISQDHYTIEVAYKAGTYKYTKDRVGTRYGYVIVRLLADPRNAADMRAAHALQDAITTEQPGGPGKFEIPNWDDASRAKTRDALLALGALGHPGVMFGSKAEVDPVAHLIGTAVAWAGSPPKEAMYDLHYPKDNDGKTPHVLTVRDVPADAFWSVSVYNAKGYFEKNDLGVYSLNSLTAKPNADGSFTLRFGGDPKADNHLPIVPGWNYTVRLFRPRKEALDGTWKFPAARPVK